MGTKTKVRPYLVVSDARAAIDFYSRAFGASELFRLIDPSGSIGHAEVAIDGEVIMLADEFPGLGFRGPKAYGGTPVSLSLDVPDVDAFVERAAAQGATTERPPKDEFYGDRCGAIVDPFGHRWLVCTRIEEVSPAEMQRRYDALAKP